MVVGVGGCGVDGRPQIVLPQVWVWVLVVVVLVVAMLLVVDH